MPTSARPPDTWLERNKSLLRFVGARLTSVQFVEMGALTALVWPEITQGSGVFRFGDISYRNRLCDLIEQVVTSAGIDEQDVIGIEFDSGNGMKIPLGAYSGVGERAILNGPNYLRVF
jgi:hypothetical protein